MIFPCQNEYSTRRSVMPVIIHPLYLLLSINDIPNRFNLSTYELILLFADDLVYITKVGKTMKRLLDAKATIDKYLEELTKWLTKWRQSMSVKKCNYILFNKTDNNKKLPFQLTIAKEEINQSATVGFLGIRFDPILKFNNQLSYIIASCSKRLNVIKILSTKQYKASAKSLLIVYNGLVRSLIDYSAVTIKCLSKDSVNKLESLQRKAIPYESYLSYNVIRPPQYSQKLAVWIQ